MDRFPPILVVALIAAVAPFFISFSSSSTSTVNGRVVESSYIDYAAIVGGGLAVVLGGIALASLFKDTLNGPKAAAGAAIALGVYQLMSGFGVI